MGETSDFLGALFPGDLPKGAAISVWTKAQGASFADSAEIAAASIEERGDNPYFGCALHSRATIKKNRLKRGSIASACAIGGVWIDVDVASGEHKKKKYPPNLQGAMGALREAFPLKPTALIHTGGGAHVWWMLHEVWEFESDEEREHAGKIVHGIQCRVREAFQARGWDLDSTHDLARVLRAPGTENTKYDPPRAVCMLEFDPESRFNQSELEEWMCAATDTAPRAPLERKGVSDRANGLVVNPSAEPPVNKLTALLEFDSQFAQTWRRERSDLKDQSQSGYDFALINICVACHWKDQEIVDLCVAHRRPAPPKVVDYYARSIERVRRDHQAEENYESLQDRVEDIASGDVETTDARGGHLKDLSALLGFEIVRIIKFPGEPEASYRLVLGDGSSVLLSDVSQILEVKKFQGRVAQSCGHVIDRRKWKDWHPISQALLQSAEVQDVGAESSVESIVKDWLSGHLRAQRPGDDRHTAISTDRPYVEKKRVYVMLEGVRKHLRYDRDNRISKRRIAETLRSAGIAPKKVYWKAADGKRSTADVWDVTAFAEEWLDTRMEVNE